MSGASVRPNPAAETTSAAKSKKTADDDADLDAYLMGALGSDDEAGGTLQTYIPFSFLRMFYNSMKKLCGTK